MAFVFGVFPFGRGRLKIDGSLLEGDTTEAKLLAQAAQMAEVPVRAGAFSRDGIPADWIPFLNRDIEFIDSVIAKSR